ncbi:unnamed protein product [Acanthoscelides obtectus]|uniref:Uncharacterized protein n=1 Tax=Acanthoscelides obtectus TaxID=200917 RepID=A0A9P0MID0_ACAOB|nr:unnamed protein product [Acanthoscelides obtectus]CAK1671935.1 Transient receptor potential-gamma protein [Acanthoscelides obtectus]
MYVSRLIGRSRSEDSVCNSCSNDGVGVGNGGSISPPPSDENASVSPTDSNHSLDTTQVATPPPTVTTHTTVPQQQQQTHHHHEPPLHSGSGISHGLALLKKKRKKFSASRNVGPVVVPPPESPMDIVSKLVGPKKFQQVLKRASSVPTRVPEVDQMIPRHEKTQSQQDSIELPVAAASTLTPSTTEESVAAYAPPTAAPASGTSREPLLFNNSSSSNAQTTMSSQTPEDEFKQHATSQSLPKLPGVIPVSGHNTSGWL